MLSTTMFPAEEHEDDDSVFSDETHQNDEESLNEILEDPERWLTGDSNDSGEEKDLRRQLADARTEIETMKREEKMKESLLRKDMYFLKNQIRYTREFAAEIESGKNNLDTKTLETKALELETKSRELQLTSNKMKEQTVILKTEYREMERKYDSIRLELGETRRREENRNDHEITSLREECERLKQDRDEACRALQCKLLQRENEEQEIRKEIECLKQERDETVRVLKSQIRTNETNERDVREELVESKRRAILEAEKDHLRELKHVQDKMKCVQKEQERLNSLHVVIRSYQNRVRCARLSRGFITWSVSLNVASNLSSRYEEKLEKIKHEHHVETQMGKHREVLAHARAEREMNEMRCNADERLKELNTEFETRLKLCENEIAESSQRVVEYETICAQLRSDSENAERSYQVQRLKLESDLEIARQNFEEQRKAMLAEQERTSRILRAEYQDNLSRKVLDMTQAKDENIERLELDSKMMRSKLEEKFRRESREVLSIQNELEIERARFESRESTMRHEMESAAQDASRVREHLSDERKRVSEWRLKLVECSEAASRDITLSHNGHRCIGISFTRSNYRYMVHKRWETT